MQIQTTSKPIGNTTAKTRHIEPLNNKAANPEEPVTTLVAGDRFTGALVGAAIAGIGASAHAGTGLGGGAMSLIGGLTTGSYFGQHIWNDMDNYPNSDSFAGTAVGGALAVGGIALGALANTGVLGSYGSVLGIAGAAGIGAVAGSRLLVPTCSSMTGKQTDGKYAQRFQDDAVKANLYRGTRTHVATGCLTATAMLGLSAGIVLGGLGAANGGLSGFVASGGAGTLALTAGLAATAAATSSLSNHFFNEAERINDTANLYSKDEMKYIRQRADFHD